MGYRKGLGGSIICDVALYLFSAFIGEPGGSPIRCGYRGTLKQDLSQFNAVALTRVHRGLRCEV